MIKLKNNNTLLEYDSYVKRGSMMYLRSALSLTDPDFLYTYLKESKELREANLTPEQFGIYHPVTEQFKDSSQEVLLNMITSLLIENENLHRNQY